MLCANLKTITRNERSCNNEVCGKVIRMEIVMCREYYLKNTKIKIWEILKMKLATLRKCSQPSYTNEVMEIILKNI